MFTNRLALSPATHPGVLLKDEIEFRGISQQELATGMNVDSKLINEIIEGKRNVTAEIALKLEKALEVDAFYWMRLQAKYDIDTLRIMEREKNPEQTDGVIAREPKSAYAKAFSGATKKPE